jgi:hypothetical protein
MGEPPTRTLDRLHEKVLAFVELAGRVRQVCGEIAEEGDGTRVERAGAVSREAERLESESRDLVERLARLRGRSRARVLIGLLSTRGRQRRVAELARQLAASFSEVARES